MTEIFEQEKLKEIISSAISDLARLTASGLKVVRMPDGSVITTGSSHQLIKLFITGGSVDKVIRSMIVDACNKVEAAAPGSSQLFLRLLKASFETGSVQHGASVASISKLSKPPSLASLEKIMRCMLPNVTDIILEAMKLAGSECKIFVEPSATRQTVIERLVGFNFRCDPDPSFFKLGKWVAYDVKCLVVDGIIENVSEMDGLLRRCNEDKRPMAIFARGFSKEVLATLRTNHVRKTLNVIPIRIEFDLETVNVLLDVATVLGCDVISSLKGELISTARFDDLVQAKSITCSGKATNIVNVGPSIDAHIKNLIKKRQSEQIPAMKRILDARLRSLSSSSVVIRIDNSGPDGSILTHELDEGLKLLRCLLINGVILHDDMKGLEPDDYVLQVIKDMGDVYPAAWLTMTLPVVDSLVQSLRSIKVAID